MTGFLLREMKADDLPAVLEIELESYTMPWTESTFRGLLRRRDADLIVAEAAGRLVGYAVAWSVLDQAELGNVAVTAGLRRRGLGRILVEEILQRTGARGVREVFLEVRPSNAGAQRLYALLGFRLAGSRTNYYQQPTEDALVMRVELPAGHLETERLDQ